MKPIVLTLEIAGKKKRFKATKEVTTAILMKSLELEDALKYEIKAIPKLYACSSYICSVFGNKFSEEDLQRNVTYTRIVPLAHEVMDYVVEIAELKISVDSTKGEVVPFETRKKS